MPYTGTGFDFVIRLCSHSVPRFDPFQGSTARTPAAAARGQIQSIRMPNHATLPRAKSPRQETAPAPAAA